MKLLPSIIYVLATAASFTAPFAAPAFAHHSEAMFDGSQELLIEGTVTRFDWKNPHMYLIVETEGPDGEMTLVEGEGLAITQALVGGLSREALQPGTPVVMRVNPNQGGWGKQVRILDVTTEDGEIHPFYEGSRTRRLTPAESIEGHWAPSGQALGAAFGAMARWPLTPASRLAQEDLVADGICYVEPTPVLSIFNEMRSIEIGEDEVVMHFDNSGDHVIRTIYMNTEHPVDVQQSRQGHAIGWWEDDTLVIDTIGFEASPSGLGLNVLSSVGKHTVERLTLTQERTRLRYENTVEDPVYLSGPATLTQQWDHRPDLEFSSASQVCDEEVATRYLDHVPE